MPDKNYSNWRLRDRSGLEKKYQKHITAKGNNSGFTTRSTRKILKTSLFFVFIISLIIFVFLIFFKPPLPDKGEIIDKVIYQEPFQNKKVIDTQLITRGDFRYKIYPQFSYELYGLVVSEYNSENILDVRHGNDPGQIKDLCVVWGQNIDTGIYKDMKYSSGEFTCYFERKDRSNRKEFSIEHRSNNHLVPANDEIADKIRKAYIGDQVYIKGYLSRYEIYNKEGNLISSRGTSVSRDDSGNGACETIFVTDFEIIKGNNYLYKLIRRSAGIMSIVSAVMLIFAVLFV